MRHGPRHGPRHGARHGRHAALCLDPLSRRSRAEICLSRTHCSSRAPRPTPPIQHGGLSAHLLAGCTYTKAWLAKGFGCSDRISRGILWRRCERRRQGRGVLLKQGGILRDLAPILNLPRPQRAMCPPSAFQRRILHSTLRAGLVSELPQFSDLLSGTFCALRLVHLAACVVYPSFASLTRNDAARGAPQQNTLLRHAAVLALLSLPSPHHNWSARV